MVVASGKYGVAIAHFYITLITANNAILLFARPVCNNPHARGIGRNDGQGYSWRGYSVWALC